MYARHHLQVHSWEVMPNLCFSRNHNEIEEDEQGAAERLGAKRLFRMNALPQFLSLLLLSLRLQVGLKASCVPFQRFSVDD